jgi:hypothetical protein
VNGLSDQTERVRVDFPRVTGPDDLRPVVIETVQQARARLK